MNKNLFKKICVLSDTHFHLSNTAANAIKGNIESNQIYDTVTLNSNFETDCKKILLKELDKRRYDCPQLIIHAGDIGDQEIINFCESICDTVAINGNCDFKTYKTKRGDTQDFYYINLDGLPIAITHRPEMLETYISGSFLHKSLLPQGAKNPELLIHGHTHQSYIDFSDIPYKLCPGSASMGRYGTPNSVAYIYVYNGKILQSELIKV